jgi:hypothetical protein
MSESPVETSERAARADLHRQELDFMNISAKKKKDLLKPKAELREGFETMQPYFPDGDYDAKDRYRYLFKGRVVVFVVADKKRHEVDGILGQRLEMLTDNPKAYVWYVAFQRASDGVVFFLGEDEKQVVSKSQRTREAIHLGRFN